MRRGALGAGSPTPRMEAAVEEEGVSMEEAGAAGSTAAAVAASTQVWAVAVSTGVGSPTGSVVEWEAAASMAAVCEAFMGEALLASTPAYLAGFTLADFPAAAFIPVHRRAREWIDWPAAHEKATP